MIIFYRSIKMLKYGRTVLQIKIEAPDRMRAHPCAGGSAAGENHLGLPGTANYRMGFKKTDRQKGDFSHGADSANFFTQMMHISLIKKVIFVLKIKKLQSNIIEIGF